MLQSIVRFSVEHKSFVGLAVAILLAVGVYAMLTLPIDAVPDITNNQVQIVTVSPTLAPQEVEKLITFPIEIAMSNIMNVEEIRSVSRFGLSLVTVVFKESVPVLDARQLINEQIQTVSSEIPSELGSPELMPITTGLGEIYQYTLKVDPAYKEKYDPMELRTIQDWIVKRQLSGIPGIVEINSFGGYLKQYEVALDPIALFSLNITISDVFEALSRNNQNTGGSYIEKKKHAYYIRSEGMIKDAQEIGKIVITNRNGIPVHIHDVAKIHMGAPKRFGAMTKDGEGECVGGIAMMLKGANANVVTQELEKRVEKVQKMLPEGVSIEPYLNRSSLVNRNISTVLFNLIEGAIIVFVVLILFLGNFRAGIIVASVIPLAMLFAFILMRIFGVSANLMSLGAIDFGIVVDGSIVIVEGILAHLYGASWRGKRLSPQQMDEQVIHGSVKVARSATFASCIILIVFFPILMLTGIEGKYFTPMAKTLLFCIIGALLLSLTYIPMMSSLILKKTIQDKKTWADRFFDFLNIYYNKILAYCLKRRWQTVTIAFVAFVSSLFLFTKLGAEFIPTLDEGDFAMQITLPAGSSLSQSVEISTQSQKILLDKFPEIKHVIAKIGTAEVPTDPMAVEDADVMIVMKPFKEWTSASSRAEMVEKMKEALSSLSDEAVFNFSQPIQLRFNELMTGAKADIAIKLYGEDMDELYKKAKEAAAYARKVPGASDVLVEQAVGLPQLLVIFDRDKIARYGMNIEELNTMIRTAYAGESSGVVFENERRFDLVVRLDQEKVTDLNLDKLFVRTYEGVQIPLSEVAKIELQMGPLQINRDATKRRIVIGVNVRDADIQQVVEQIRTELETNIRLQPGYYFEYGGQFENLQNAINTLLVVVPAALLLILLLLFFAFRNFGYTMLVFMTIPFSLIGGIAALWIRGLPFSISAGVGFIALFGVTVLNGILMINRFMEERSSKKHHASTGSVIRKSCPHLLRPVFLTGLVASLGFVPMAVATTAGAEVQRPLATVVIGGLLVSTFLTLIIVPVFYRMLHTVSVRSKRRSSLKTVPVLLFFALLSCASLQGETVLSLDSALNMAIRRSPRLLNTVLEKERIQASKGESWEFSPTTVSYSWGQLNSYNHKDNALNVEQSLGSLMTPFYKNALVNKTLQTHQSYTQIVTKEVTAEVKRAWYTYIYAFNKAKMYASQSELADKVCQVSDLLFEKGEVGTVEKNMMITVAAEMKNRFFQAQSEMKIAQTRLQWICYSEEPLMPDQTILSLAPVAIAQEPVSPVYRNYFDRQTAEKKSIIQVEASRFFPQIHLGYSYQNILPERDLNGWTAGISFPIFFMSEYSRIKQAKLAYQMSLHQAEANKRELTNKCSELHSLISQYGQSVRFYTGTVLSQAEALIKTATQQLELQEIDITQWVQIMNSAKEIQNGYLEAVYQYNIVAIEYELYQ